MIGNGQPAAYTDPAAGRRSLRRGYLLATLVLIGSLALVALYARSANERERRATEAEYLVEAERIATQLRERLLRYELALRGGVSLFSSVSRPTQRQWRGYVEGLHIARQFPGIMGLGYSSYLTRGELELLQLEMRAAGQGLFHIRPIGVRELYGPIIYLEPMTPENRAAIGYDMFSEPMRNATMAAARDTGQVRLSGPVRFELHPSDTYNPAGLLIYAPVYTGGISPETLASRRIAMSGWVYAPFAIRPFVEGVLGMQPTDHAIRIVDVTDGKEQLVYLDARFGDQSSSAWSHSTSKEVYGRTWRVDFRAPQWQRRSMSDLQATLVAGVFTSLLLFLVVLSLAYTQTHAEWIAARMSESWRRSELRFRSAMQSSALGHALLDSAWRIVETNPALGRILGGDPAGLAGRSLESLLMPPGRGELPLESAASDEGVRITRRVQRPDGDLRHVQLIFSAVPGDIGSDVSSLVQVEDITDRLRAEEQVRGLNRVLEARVEQRTRELMRANRELESFAYSVSHDLRAPLRTVEGFGRVLADRYGEAMDEEGRGYLARIRNAANRMDALIDALLKMSRISRDSLEAVPLNLSRIAAELVGELRQAEPEREVEIEIESGMTASGDAALVRDLLQNLLGNAWKFTRDTAGARIAFVRQSSVDGSGNGRMEAFLVRDNGAGFDPAYADKLFRPFQRLHSAEHFGGHGIGLASVKRIVERHGGTIEAEGRPGAGATFRFTLPGADAAGRTEEGGA